MATTLTREPSTEPSTVDWLERWAAESAAIAGVADTGRVVDPFLMPEVEVPC
jgi:hypothetical protein